jgi:hypothetical protein
MAVLSAPISSAIAVATSMAKRVGVGDGAAIFIGARIGVWGEELLDEITVRTVNLDTISAGVNGRARRMAEVGDGPAHFLGRQRARRGNVLHPCRGEHLTFRRDRGGCYALTVMRRIVGMRHTPGVHDLDEDTAARGMHGGGHLLPPRDMRWAVDARRREVALAVIGRLGAFGDDQADAGALGIIFGGQFSRRAVELGAAASHRGHHQTVRQSVASDTDGRE